MSRTLSATIQSLLTESRTSVCHLLSFTVGGTTYRFAEDRIQFQDEIWLPHLTQFSPIRYSQRLRSEAVQVELQNITLEMAGILKTEQEDLLGAEATLQRLFLKSNEAVILMVGKIREAEVDERNLTLTLGGELDPTSAQIPQRKYSSLCVWDFGDARCGYTAGEDPDDTNTGLPFFICPKDFSSCQSRGRQHRFSGFIHITREVTESVEGPNAGLQDNGRALADYAVWDEP